MIAKHFCLEVPGVPVAKGRPRMTKAGHTYTPMRTRNYEADLRVLAKQRMRGVQPMEGPLQVEIIAYMPMPQSWPKWKRSLVTEHGVFIRHTTKPDIDNLGKIIDGLNGVVWADDSQICDLTVRKRYSLEPRLVIVVQHDPQVIHSKTTKRPSARAATECMS